MRTVALFIALLSAACGANDNGAPPPERNERPGCRPPELTNTPAIGLVEVSPGCRFIGGGTARAPRVVSSVQELEQVLACPGGPPIAIDLGDHDLAVVGFTMSPAYGGTEVLDDGATITIVTQDRPPCPGDPQAMPTPSFFAFPLPKGAERTFAQASCALVAHCDD